jgi:hypothetical protein
MAETPKYSVSRKQNEIEIRQYPGYIQAEVTVDDKNYKSAIEKGFNLLAGNIFSNNISRQKIEMTTPVQASQSEKIAMTTPVTVTSASSFTVAFIMPAEYTLETLPQPIDTRVTLRGSRLVQWPRSVFPDISRKIRSRKTSSASVIGWRNRDLKPKVILSLLVTIPRGCRVFLARNEVLIQLKAALQEKR